MYNTKNEPYIMDFWKIMLYLYRFINCNKCTNVVGNIDRQEILCVCGDRFHILSTQFFCESKTAFKNKEYLGGKKNKKQLNSKNIKQPNLK